MELINNLQGALIDALIKNLLEILPDTIIDKESCYNWLRIKSIQHAVKSQGLSELYKRLSSIVPDIKFQYSTSVIDSEYSETKVRAQHSFQISMVERALKLVELEQNECITIVDIGDSAGTHLQYLQGLHKNIRALSVNLDINAVEKIRKKGMEAVHARAEEIEQYSINPDLFLSFEMLEHLSDPIHFLKRLSEGGSCKAFVITVPYLAQSRIGLHHIRGSDKREVFPENTHIFELSPSDWELIFLHSGWSIIYDEIYLQYPKEGLFSFMKNHWKNTDFEGFYGAILKKDSSWSKLYKDW